MINLIEEYSKYNDLISEKEVLNEKVKSLVGKNDPESISQINEIAKKINEVNQNLSIYNKDTVEEVEVYLNLLEEISKVVEDIHYIEKLTKKATHNNDKVEVLSAEGRKKYIDPEYVEQYKRLVERKKELRKKNTSHYNNLKNIVSMVNPAETKETIVENAPAYILPELPNYNDLTIDEKIQDTRERIDRIFKSAEQFPTWKKTEVTFEGKKYVIPSRYNGRFVTAVKYLNKLLDKKNNISTKKSDNETKNNKQKLTLPVVNEMVKDKKNNEIKPIVEVSFKNKQRISSYGKLTNIDKRIEKNVKKLRGRLIDKGIQIKKGYVNFKEGTKQKYNTAKSYIKSIPTRAKNFAKSKIKSALNIDKKVSLAAKKFHGKLISKGIQIKTGYVNFKQGTKQKYDKAKTFVTSMPTRTKNFIVEKYKSFTNFFREKKEIIQGIKENDGIKNSMERVYGDKKDEHLDYRIINRTANFKENTCHRIEEATTKIATVSKSFIDKIKAPFVRLRDAMANDVERQRLIEEIKKVEQENREKIEAYKRIRVKQNSGYVAFGSLLVVSTLALAAVIFTIIGTLLNR